MTDDEWRERALVVRHLELTHEHLVAGLMEQYPNYSTHALRKWPAAARRLDAQHGWGIFPTPQTPDHKEQDR